MVSTIRYPTFKQVDWRTKTRLWTFILVLIMGALAWKLQEIALLVLFLGYIFYGVIRHLRRAQIISRIRLQRKQSVKNVSGSVQ
jgi:CDP-diacylglycerol--serine O-phosphatidyltransferase